MPLPPDLSPMLATTGALPSGAGWAHEVKWDGVRALVAVQGGAVRLTSRNGNDVTAAYPELGALGVAVPGPALLDGEVVALDAAGIPDFGRLQSRMHVRRPAAALVRSVPVTLVLFDLLHTGSSQLAKPYDERRALLEAMALDGPSWSTPPVLDGDAEDVLAATRRQGLEGVVAKRRDSRYEPGRRSPCWVKAKHVRRQSAVIAGWKAGEGGRSGQIGSLLIGVREGRELRYAGHVGTGFTGAVLARLAGQLAALRRPTSPFADEVPREHARSAVWVEPVLVCEVEFTAWTRDGRLRHPSYKGLRDDVDPGQVVRE